MGEEAQCAPRHTNIAGSTGVVVSGQRGGSGRRRSSVAVGFVFQMFEDPLDDTRLGDEGDHAEFAAVAWRAALLFS